MPGVDHRTSGHRIGPYTPSSLVVSIHHPQKVCTHRRVREAVLHAIALVVVVRGPVFAHPSRHPHWYGITAALERHTFHPSLPTHRTCSGQSQGRKYCSWQARSQPTPNLSIDCNPSDSSECALRHRRAAILLGARKIDKPTDGTALLTPLACGDGHWLECILKPFRAPSLFARLLISLGV